MSNNDLGMCRIVGDHQFPEHQGKLVWAVYDSLLEDDNGNFRPLWDAGLRCHEGKRILWVRRHLKPFGDFDPAEELWSINEREHAV